MACLGEGEKNGGTGRDQRAVREPNTGKLREKRIKWPAVCK